GRAGLGTRLVEALRNAGHTATIVEIGEQFARLRAGAFSLRPGESADYEALIQSLTESGDTPNTIVHLWSVGAAGGLALGPIQPPAEERGFYSLLFLAQARGGQPAIANLRLVGISAGMSDL